MRLIFLVALIFSSTYVYSAPLDGLNKFGEGEMKVLFWHLYKAELFGESENYTVNDDNLSLKITYKRDISKRDLIDATLEQWEHVGIDHKHIPDWLAKLDEIWPDIKEDDVLIFAKNNDNSATFFYDSNTLGTIDDPEFADAFLAIWLSENTSRPKLREKLIGSDK
jgi:hypothetical protein